jgi:hypothetical protein
VFYIRYSEERVNIGEVIQFKTKQIDQGKLKIELWFLEAAESELNQEPPSTFTRIALMQKVSEK